jgi:hypothetical protein
LIFSPAGDNGLFGIIHKANRFLNDLFRTQREAYH